MSSSELIFYAMRERYQTQRDRREQIRGSVATPVTAMAFSVYTLAWVTGRVDVSQWQHPIGFAVIALAVVSVLCLLGGAFLIVRMERDVIYIDPPDLQELVYAEAQLKEKSGGDDALVEQQLRDMMTASYDIIYRRYFATNEQTSRDRTRGLHLIVFGLCSIMVALLLLPLQPGGLG